MDKKILVAYFSAEGTTAVKAKEIAAATGGDLYEIEPVERYTAKDLDWRDKKSRSTLEMTDPSSRPPVKNDVDISGYDKIFIGFPVWWYVEPRIVDTFLEAHDFKGKTIIPFATSGGSGFGKTIESLVPSCPGAQIREGKLLNGNPSVDELKKWVDSL